MENIEELELEELLDVIYYLEEYQEIPIEDINFNDLMEYLERDISSNLIEGSVALEEEWGYNLDMRLKELTPKRREDYLKYIKWEEEHGNDDF